MSVPSNAEILALLDQLDLYKGDELETHWLDFKTWMGTREDMKTAIEYASCMANADGGVVVFGVDDAKVGRAQAIHGADNYSLDHWRREIYQQTRPTLSVDVEELSVPEGTGRLLIVRIPPGAGQVYGTAAGLFKKRVGKNCMPLDPQALLHTRVATGAVDWSGQPAEGITVDQLDRVEIARGRNVLRRSNPESSLLQVSDAEFLRGLGAVRNGQVTHAGLLLFGSQDLLIAHCPQHMVHYVYQTQPTAVDRNDSLRCGLLQALDLIEQAFSGPANPEQEITDGL